MSISSVRYITCLSTMSTFILLPIYLNQFSLFADLVFFSVHSFFIRNVCLRIYLSLLICFVRHVYRYLPSSLACLLIYLVSLPSFISLSLSVSLYTSFSLSLSLSHSPLHACVCMSCLTSTNNTQAFHLNFVQTHTVEGECVYCVRCNRL